MSSQRFRKEPFFFSITLFYFLLLCLLVPICATATDNNDTDGDGMTNADESAIGRDPNFAELHDWEPDYNASSSDWNASLDGNWTVNLSDGNLSVLQSSNAYSTHFLSPIDFINVEINGTMKVSLNDNDYIGFYFGYTEDAETNRSSYFHFKWSRSEVIDTFPLDGWNLLEITDGATSRLDYNESNTSKKGWELDMEHNFSLIYTEGNMTLRMLGDDNNFSDYPILFSREGNFSAGKFGFWTGSQADANFSNIRFTQLHPPVIELIGDANVTHEAATAYIDSDANVTDVEDGNESSLLALVSDVNVSNAGSYADVFNTITNPAEVEIISDINVSVPGTYQVIYKVKDSSDIERNATRTVNVVDTTIPVITLNGESSLTIEAGTDYSDANATWADTVDGNGALVSTDVVDILIPGDYELNFNHTDNAGNDAIEVTRLVTIADTTSPIIALNADEDDNDTVTFHEVGQSWEDPGATWTDIVDGNGSPTTSGSVNENVVGTYVLSYNYTDVAGNAAVEVTRTVKVVDTTSPIVSLLGEGVVTHEAATSSYSDPGALWSDYADSNDSNSSEGLNISGTVDYSVPGNYTLVYSYTDEAGNVGNATRTIVVVDSTPPVLTILGDANYTMGVWQEYVDPGVLANDSVDGSLPVSVLSNNVDINNVGSYQVVYFAEDAAGNEVNTTRVINVVNADPTDISLSPFSVYENMPANSLVGYLEATDPDDSSNQKNYSFEILQTNQTDYQLFSIDSSGGLRISSVFDFELDSNASIIVRVTDEFGGAFEKELIIQISDASIPIIETTINPIVASDGSLEVGLNLIDAGGNASLVEWGVLVSSKTIDGLDSSGAQRIELSYSSDQSSASTRFVPGSTWDTVFVRAYAINGEGVGYGLEESTSYSKQYIAWADALPVSNSPGWWESPWIGFLYKTEESPWVMHVELGWIYPVPSTDGSVWVWQEEIDWLWTSPENYPYFYSPSTGGWKYFFGKVGESRVFYDYKQNSWSSVVSGNSPNEP